MVCFNDGTNDYITSNKMNNDEKVRLNYELLLLLLPFLPFSCLLWSRSPQNYFGVNLEKCAKAYVWSNIEYTQKTKNRSHVLWKYDVVFFDFVFGQTASWKWLYDVYILLYILSIYISYMYKTLWEYTMTIYIYIYICIYIYT